MSLWEQVKDNLVEIYSVAADKTEEVAKVGIRRYDRMGINWDIKRQFTELGGMVYQAIAEERSDILDDPAVTAIIERIKGLEVELAAKENEIADIKKTHAERRETVGRSRQDDAPVGDEAIPVAIGSAASDGPDIGEAAPEDAIVTPEQPLSDVDENAEIRVTDSMDDADPTHGEQSAPAFAESGGDDAADSDTDKPEEFRENK